MNLETFAFVNQQLAGMLQSGLTLEGSLRHLCAEMERGELRDELRALEADLGKGTPLREALGARRLPAFYTQMLLVGAQSNDLPAVLTLLADYYNRVHLAWTRLKGLLIYPLIVLVSSFALALLLALVFKRLLHACSEELGAGFFFDGSAGLPGVAGINFYMWGPTVLIGLLLLLFVLGVSVPSWRRALRWRVPAFRESSLSQMASAISVMLERGCSLDRALSLAQQLEADSPMGREIALWQTRLAAGSKDFADLAEGGKTVPPLFVWLVSGSGENWAAGFKHAAKVYYERAQHRVELLLYAALPVSVLALGLLILAQVLPMMHLFVKVMRSMSEVSGVGD